MAKYDVTFSCGHTETIQLFKKETSIFMTKATSTHGLKHLINWKMSLIRLALRKLGQEQSTFI